jgi:hypothetical protein
VPHGPLAGIADADVARVLLRRVQELLERRERGVGAHHQHRRVGIQLGDRHEFVPAELRQAQVVQERDLHRREGQLVAVRLRVDHVGPADHAGGAGLVHHDEALGEVLHGRRGEGARHHVGPAARGIGHHDFHRALRIAGFGRGGLRQRQQRAGRGHGGQDGDA